MGAIGIDRRTTATAIEGMEAAAAWLDGPHKSLWVYPQGRYRPSHMRPLELQRGVSILQKHANATVIPVTMQLHYFLAHLPTCAITFGAPIELRGRKMMAALETAMLDQLGEQTPGTTRGKGPAVRALGAKPHRPHRGSLAVAPWAWCLRVYRRIKQTVLG